MDYERLIAATSASAFLHLTGLVGLSLLPSGDGTGSLTQSGGRPITVAFRSSPQQQTPIAEDGADAIEPEIKPDEPVIPATQFVDPEKYAEVAPNTQNPGAEGVLHAPFYYRSREVDVLAAPIGAISPDSQTLAGIKTPSGYLVIELLINETGGVDKATVLESRPEGVFDSLEVSAFGNARFTPAMKDGKPVKSRMKFEVRYGIEPLETVPVQPVVQKP